jgi:hypothetical protein
MSINYSVFVNNKQGVDSVVLGLEAILNCKLVRKTVDRKEYCSTILLGLGISLAFPVTLEDDGVINFSEYDYEIMVEYTGLFDHQYSYEYCRIVTIVLAEMVSRKLDCECLATENLDRLERFICGESDISNQV